ncbi:MAG TPA: methyltransferase [Casimicrobiaceae bacterium]|nr:methyltransferase [Casimicrobiaceae bacterium]
MQTAVGSGSTEALAARLLSLLHGFRPSCVIAAAVELGVLDRLAAGPLTAEELAKRVGAHESSLLRFLRALEALDIVAPGASGFSLTSLGRVLLDSHAGVRERALLVGEEYLPAWSRLGEAVRTGEPAFPAAFGMSVWEHRRAHPELDASFNRAMGDQEARGRSSVLAAYDFSGCRVVVDVGGGSGALMAEILRRYPGATGVVFDQPHVVEQARALLAAEGVLDRCRVAGGSFLDAVPAGGDAYVLRYVLHDWSDRDCATILRRCRDAMGASSVLLVVENTIVEGARPSVPLAMLDLHMMVMLGGRERTAEEYRSLLRSEGFEIRDSLAGHRPGAEIIVAARDSAQART